MRYEDERRREPSHVSLSRPYGWVSGLKEEEIVKIDDHPRDRIAVTRDGDDQTLMYVRIDPEITSRIERIEEKLDRLLARRHP
jgi:hypothetical protein